MAAWSCGEREEVSDAVLGALIGWPRGAGASEDRSVREAAVAALGAIGDARGLPAILAASERQAGGPAARRARPRSVRRRRGTRRRRRALDDRDWQVRQAAEDLLAARANRAR